MRSPDWSGGLGRHRKSLGLRRTERRPGGYMLVAALAILTVLFTIAMALNYMAGSAHAAYMMNEAQLEAEQSLSEQVAVKGTQLQGVDPPTGGGSFEVTCQQASDSREEVPPPKIGAEVFGAAGKKDAGFTRQAGYNDGALTTALTDYNASPWESLLGWAPKTWRADMKVFGRRRYVTAFNAEFPYAAYAPGGSVSLKQAVAWVNPVFLQDVGPDPTTAYSGLPVMLAAHDDITVTDAFPYGETYTVSGKVKLPKGAGGIAYYGPLPLQAGGTEVYAARVLSDINGAFSAFDSATQAGNKTPQFNTAWSIDNVISVFTGSVSAMRDGLSLRNALKFPLPMIPGFASAPPYYRLIFHMPFAPDFSSSGAKNDGSQIPSVDSKLNDQINDTKKALDEAKQKVLDAIEPDIIKDLQKKVDELQGQLDNLVNQFKNQVANAKNAIDNMKPGSDDGPPTRHAEADSGIDDDGDKGYAYSAVAKSLWGLLEGMVDAISGGGLGAFMKQVTHDVRLVYFGRQDNVAQFNITDSAIDMKSTLNVPRGRTLRLDTDVTVRGDVWVGRGAVLQVGGNLSIVAPGAVGDDPMTPSGRLFLEEGASVVVGGSFTCQGSAKYGSIIVCGPIGKIHPITSGLLVRHNVTVPYGIYSGAVLDEMATSLLGKSTLQTALDNLAPNVAKLAGPFHRRKPYLAAWASVIGIVTPVPFVGFVAFPEPSQTPNMLVPIFRAMSMLYTGALNETLGENMYTHTDWWIFGDGVVPVIPKLAPDAAKAVLDGVVSGFPSLASNVASMVGGYIASMVTDMLGTVIKQVVEQLIAQAMQAIPYGSLVSAAVSSALDTLKNKLMDKVTQAENQALSSVGGMTESNATSLEGSVVSALKSSLQGALDAGILAALTRECAGLLVYGHDSVKVGTGGGAPLAVGMFVSDGNIQIDTDYVVGSLLSAHGGISAKQVLFYPYFTRASLSVPREAAFDGDWLKKGVDQITYGAAMYDSGSTPDAVDIGPTVERMTAGGWDQ